MSSSTSGGDCVFIEELSVPARIGVYDWEEERPRLLRISVRLAWDNQSAGRTDDLQQALDYAALAATIRTVAAERPYRLLETLAESLAEVIFQRFAPPALSLRIDKPDAVAGALAVGIEIQRTAPSG